MQSLLKPLKNFYSYQAFSQLHGSAFALAIANVISEEKKPCVIVAPDPLAALKIESELSFFLNDISLPILLFPEWETLPYDIFSPHQDIISLRLNALNHLALGKPGILITTINSAMNRLSPLSYVSANTFNFTSGDKLDPHQLRSTLISNGYHLRDQVYEHGEFAIRGSIIDLYPMGSNSPYRLELFDNEIETIRVFDPDTQRSISKESESTLTDIKTMLVLPAKEFPLTPEAISTFRVNWRERFTGNPNDCSIYQDISQGIASPGIEYYLPLFFEKTTSILDFVPEKTPVFLFDSCYKKAQEYWKEIIERHDQLSHDVNHPILKPIEVFWSVDEIFKKLKSFHQVELKENGSEDKKSSTVFFDSEILPDLNTKEIANNPFSNLKNYIEKTKNRILICAETKGRREVILHLLTGIDIKPTLVENWQEFLSVKDFICLTVYPLESGLVSLKENITVISEPQLFGNRPLHKRKKRENQKDADNIIRHLAELKPGDPVVHLDHGVGRYLGLETISIDHFPADFLVLAYADNTKLYVPVTNLNLISRYTGVNAETAPLHRLGTDRWSKAKKEAAEKAHDVAVELLDVYARRAAQKGFAFEVNYEYELFANQFSFDETPDQISTIEAIIQDMSSEKTMDRLVCGDVGFGKTEVAMRAAFIASHQGKQVAMLCPTTLLAEQHYQTFSSRFADWPIKIAVLSRFKTQKQQTEILEQTRDGKIDILIGTHKLLNSEIQLPNLGLLIIDEEHRFGVKQKEKLKSIRSNVDILALTATPIPRTLNMAFSGIRDLSIIATPPAKRLAIKTFLQQKNNLVIREAVLREILRGGQVYFLHNHVETIEQTARELSELIPEAKFGIGHGQMQERELEKVMSDFYHRRFNVLLATTIIETGIDVPSANTIIIDRADKFGLAQLYQLRGRVGRSHHQAYAYLLIPNKKSITSDAIKRLEALCSLEKLGSGFTLATHDLEIRGAGELLGEEQSGQIQEVGFSLYMEMLQKAVNTIKNGGTIDFNQPISSACEIDIKIIALIPEEYLPDVNHRLLFYKRIANAKNEAELIELEIEMTDRFGLLPEQTKRLFQISKLKLIANTIGIQKITMGNTESKFNFSEKPNIDPLRLLQFIQKNSNEFQFNGPTKIKWKHPLIQEPEKKLTQLEDLLNTFSTMKQD